MIKPGAIETATAPVAELFTHDMVDVNIDSKWGDKGEDMG